MFGSTRRQILFKVQLPQAVPSIMTGVNQTINMALGIIIIAALVGAGGLGQEALEMLRQRRTGRGLVVGLCRAVLWRSCSIGVCRSFVERRERGTTTTSEHRRWILMAVGAIVLVVVGRAAALDGVPARLRREVGRLRRRPP